MKGLSKQKAKAQLKAKRANAKKSGCEDELEDARGDPTRKDELPDLKVALEVAKQNFDDAKELEEEAIVEFDAAAKENFEGVFVIMKKVSVAVNDVYQNVLLANGMSECEYSLKRLYFLFGTTIQAYCGQTAAVYTSFLEDTAVVNPKSSKKLVLQAIEDGGEVKLSSKMKMLVQGQQ